MRRGLNIVWLRQETICRELLNIVNTQITGIQLLRLRLMTSLMYPTSLRFSTSSSSLCTSVTARRRGQPFEESLTDLECLFERRIILVGEEVLHQPKQTIVDPRLRHCALSQSGNRHLILEFPSLRCFKVFRVDV